MSGRLAAKQAAARKAAGVPEPPRKQPVADATKGRLARKRLAAVAAVEDIHDTPAEGFSTFVAAADPVKAPKVKKGKKGK